VQLVFRPTPKLKDHLLSALRDCLFNIFAATLHPQPEDVPCRDDRDPHNMVQLKLCNFIKKKKGRHKIFFHAL